VKDGGNAPHTSDYHTLRDGFTDRRVGHLSIFWWTWYLTFLNTIKLKMKDISNNLVCCIACKKCTSYKGIFTHFARAHGDENTKKKFNSGLSAETKNKITKNNFSKLLLKLKTYYSNPNFCNNCNCELDWFQRGCKFCSHSCSAIFNKHKIPKISDTTKRKIKESLARHFKQINQPKEDFLLNFVGPILQKPHPTNNRLPTAPVGEYCKIYHCKCKFCESLFIKSSPKRICTTCKIQQNKLQMDYTFKFNVFDYPDLFDINLLTKIGWYAPRGKSGKWNPEGLSRDHKISISSAIKNCYDPFYISHPLNCQLMPHSENNTKKQKCSISYEELKNLVDEFERRKNSMVEAQKIEFL
jgi:hypothetical protein